MTTDTTISTTPKAMIWTGRVISTLPVLPLTMSILSKFFPPADMEKNLATLGWKMDQMLVLGIVELTSVILYVFPKTSILGAILLTGYLGGATATHARVQDPLPNVLTPVFIGVLVWLGLWFRDARLRALTPWRK